MTKTTEGIVPADPDRCQAEVPNGHSFMTLGGSPGRERCSNTPGFIVTENKAGPDGKRGTMSLCERCLDVFRRQVPDAAVTVWSRV